MNHPSTSVNHWLWIGGAVVLHLLMLSLPPVNLEFVFADAAKYFINPANVQLIEQYFYYQANTLGVPGLSAILLKVVPSMDALIAVRVVSIMGIALFGWSLIRIAQYLGRPLNSALLWVMLLNPLIWTYSGRGTADFLPAAVGLCSVALALGMPGKTSRLLLAGLVMGVAAVLKYHELALLIVLFSLVAPQQGWRHAWVATSIVAIVAVAILAVYLLWMHSEFGFWVTPARFQEIHEITLKNILSNFVAYAGFLILLSMPFAFLVPGLLRAIYVHWKLALPMIFTLLTIGVYFIKDTGEMNLGPLDRWISKPVLAAGFMAFAIMCFIPFLNDSQATAEEARKKRYLSSALLLILLTFSFSRPAQRYLVPFFPLFLLVLPQRVFRMSRITLTVIAIFVVVNGFISYSQWCTGMVAQKMVAVLKQSGKLELTDPGVIEGHVGNYFPNAPRAGMQFAVVNGVPEGAVISIQSEFVFLRKSISLMELTGSNDINSFGE
jgi:hypothetical protein